MLAILLLFPVFLLVIFGYAVNFDVENIRLAVKDNDNSELSEEFVRSFIHSGYFIPVKHVSKDQDIKKILDEKLAQCVMVLPENFSKDFYANRNTTVQFLIDGVDGNTATVIQSYAQTATANFNTILNQRNLLRAGVKPMQLLDIRPMIWYNPELKTTRYLIPGLIGMILIISAVISVSLSFVREKERGTIEQVNVSPITVLELLIGKAFPYLLLALFDAAIILTAGYFIFGVVVKGSLLLLFCSTIVFLSAAISLGVLISVISDSQQVAFMIATMMSLLPSVILSGFIFPIESMPPIIQIISNITPVKFYIITLRAIILRGVGLSAFWEQWVYLILFTVTFLTLAAVGFLKQLKNN
jgi:ABC-2 type transport system permease protein